MSENSQTLLRHILEAPYPGDSAVCLSAGVCCIASMLTQASAFLFLASSIG
jgi:hypothetical protein